MRPPLFQGGAEFSNQSLADPKTAPLGFRFPRDLAVVEPTRGRGRSRGRSLRRLWTGAYQLVRDAEESGDCGSRTTCYGHSSQVLTDDEQAAAGMWDHPDRGRFRATSPGRCRQDAGAKALASKESGLPAA